MIDFIENMSGLIKRKLISYISIIKGNRDRDNNLIDVEIELRICCEICMNINKLIQKRHLQSMTSFCRLYARLQKTSHLTNILNKLS